MQQSELDFIKTLRQSSWYIKQHRGKICVIYVPGELLLDKPALNQLSEDIGLLHNLGLKMVLVMGATQQINFALQAASISWQQHLQFRITTPDMLPILQQTIGLARNQIEAVFSQANGTQSSPITLISGNWITAKPKGVIDGIDFQYTGSLLKINHQAIAASLDSEQVPLLTPLAYSLTGEVFNLNTLDQACEVANALQADKLIIFGSDLQLKLLPEQLSLPQLAKIKLQSQNIIQSQFLEQVSQTSHTVKRIHLMNQQKPSTLLLELFTQNGSGTLIFSDCYHQLRTANIDDVGGILALISPLESEGILVKRSREHLELEIEYFVVIERDQHIIGCAALYPLEKNQGELACLAIHPSYQGQKLGTKLLNAIEKRALSLNLKNLFLLTTQTHHWFIKHGFKLAKPSTLPKEKQSLYNNQRQAKVLLKCYQRS